MTTTSGGQHGAESPYRVSCGDYRSPAFPGHFGHSSWGNNGTMRLSHQAAPLEIDTAVPVSQVHAGTLLIGHTPVFSARGDWHVARLGVDRKFRWAPNGVNSHLCITATSDVAGSRPRLQQCVTGTAGSSHQLWRPINVIDNGFRVYQNEANGLVLALDSDSSGTPLRLRHMLLGTGDNKNFVLNKPF